MAKSETLVFQSWVGDTLFNKSAEASLSGDDLVLPATSSYPTAITVSKYDVTDSHFGLELVKPPNVDNGSVSGNIAVTIDALNQVLFGWENDQLRVEMKINDVYSWHGYIAYSAINHKYLRISESAGTLRAQFSGDGKTWGDVYNVATPFNMTNVDLTVISGNWNGAVTPGEAHYGGVNDFGQVIATTTDASIKQADGTWLPVTLKMVP